MVNMPSKVNLGGDAGIKESIGGVIEFETEDASRWADMPETQEIVDINAVEAEEDDVVEDDVVEDAVEAEEAIDYWVLTKKELVGLVKEKGVSESEYKYANKNQLIELLK